MTKGPDDGPEAEVGATPLSGMALAVVAGLGALIIFVIFIRALSTHDYSHEPPMPPGADGG